MGKIINSLYPEPSKEETNISFFKKLVDRLASLNNCMYAYDAYGAHDGICIKIY